MSVCDQRRQPEAKILRTGLGGGSPQVGVEATLQDICPRHLQIVLLLIPQMMYIHVASALLLCNLLPLGSYCGEDVVSI